MLGKMQTEVPRESRALPVMSWLPRGERVQEATGGLPQACSRLMTPYLALWEGMALLPSGWGSRGPGWEARGWENSRSTEEGCEGQSLGPPGGLPGGQPAT